MRVWESLPPLIVLLALSLLAMPPASLADTGPASGKTAPITVTYSFPPPELVSADYVSVTMNGLAQWSEPGLPVLPFQTVRILLPQGTEVRDIAVTCGKKVSLSGSFLVQPGQQPVLLSYEGQVEAVPPDEEAYNSSAPFPGRLYSDVTLQSKRGYLILLLNLHPVEYIPREGKLSYYESLTVTVTPQAASRDALYRGLPQDREMVGALVDNPGTLSTYSAPVSLLKGSLLSPDDYEYVIITNETLNATPGPNNFQALRDEKISRNITATIVTTEWIYANYNGSRPDGGVDNQTRIRNFIVDAYENWSTSYVSLGGDGDGGGGGQKIIPHRGFWGHISGDFLPSTLTEVTDYDIPADMYYACLDGTFDYNANGTYGEVGDGENGTEVDLFAEVYVGRAPVDSQTEVQNFVNKTLTYENISWGDENLRKVWMVGDWLRFGGISEYASSYKDEIKQGSSAHNYTTVGFEDSIYAPRYDVSTLYDYPGYNYTKSEIIGIMNNNTHLINHLGHGNVNYVMKMYNSDADALTNDKLYFIGYTQACYCGAFDNRLTTPGSYYGDDCIIEHFVTGAHGAVAFIANSRFGIAAGNSTDGPSQHFDRQFWDAVLGESKLNIGVANQDSKEENAGRLNSSLEDRWCYYELNLFGDPELRVKMLPCCCCGNICVNTTGWWPDGGNFTPSSTPIQDAVNNASSGDVICVGDGTYNENVDVNVANLTIKSENGTANCIVNASSSSDHVFNVTANWTNITGFTVENATETNIAGIYLDSTAHYCNISCNNITRDDCGIYLNYNSDNNILTSNTASNNSFAGICLDSSSNNNITNNTANSNSDYGIYLGGSDNNIITNNTASNNYYGIGLVPSSNNNTLTSNTASNNHDEGIVVWSSSNNTLTSNIALNNSDGIRLWYSSNNNLTNNTAGNNTNRGIWLYSSYNNTFTSNTASNNGAYGIYLNSSSSNTIYNNYFNNTNNAWDNGNNTWNTTKTAGTNIIGGPYLGGNYWSDYSGNDTDEDGLGDTLVPYNSTGNISSGGDYLPLVPPAPATIKGTVYEANASVLADATIVLKCGNSTVGNTTTNASGYYNFTVNSTCNYTVNVTKSGLFSPVQKWANITAMGQNTPCNFTGMDAPYRTAPDGYYCTKCSNLWLMGGFYPVEFRLDATRVSDVLYAWTHPS